MVVGEPRSVRTLTIRRRTVAVVLAALLGLVIVPAYADQAYPSAGEVERAKTAVTTAEGQVAALAMAGSVEAGNKCVARCCYSRQHGQLMAREVVGRSL